MALSLKSSVHQAHARSASRHPLPHAQPAWCTAASCVPVMVLRGQGPCMHECMSHQPYLGAVHGDGDHNPAVGGQGEGLGQHSCVSRASQGSFPPGVLGGLHRLLAGHRPRPGQAAALRASVVMDAAARAAMPWVPWQPAAQARAMAPSVGCSTGPQYAGALGHWSNSSWPGWKIQQHSCHLPQGREGCVSPAGLCSTPSRMDSGSH